MNEQQKQQALKEINLNLNDKFTVPQNNITSLIIDYDIENPYISGSFELETEFDVGEAVQFDGEMNIILDATDQLDTKIQEKFVVFDFSCVRGASKNFTTTGKFLDLVSWELSKKFTSKAFVNTDMGEILKDKDIAKEIFDKVSKELDFDNTNKVENFVITANKNLLSIQKRLKEYFNCVYFHTHDKIKIKTWDNLLGSNVLKVGGKEVTYNSPTDDAAPLFDVIEYKTMTLNGLDLVKHGIKAKTFSYNPLKRSVKPFEYNLEKANEDLKNPSKIKDLTQGEKVVYYSYINPEEQTKYSFQRHIMFNSRFMLISTGFFCVNPGDTVNLSIKGMEDAVENISGKYLISRVTDSISQGYITQKVELCRPSPAEALK